jgi:hypothetical protein
MDYHQKQYKHTCIWLMSAEDTFIYSQLYQLLNKLNNLRHEILSITTGYWCMNTTITRMTG